MKKIISAAAVAAGVLLLTAPAAMAAEFFHADRESGNLTLSASETHHNVYAVGGSVFINSTTTGDLYVAGGNITVEGPVEQDLVIAGGNVTINGKVGGDIRIVGGNITINNSVGGDVLMAGGSLHLSENASVAGDLVTCGGQISVDGPVAGNVSISGGAITLNNTFPGKVKVVSNKELTFGSKANIAGPVEYHGVKEARKMDGAQVGIVNFTQMKHRGRAGAALASIVTALFVVKAIAVILAGLLLMKLFPRTAQNALHFMQKNMWINLGIGIVGLIVTPIVSVIILFLVVGFYIAALAMMLWVILLMLSGLVAAVLVGSWIISKLTQKPMHYDWQALVIGTIAMAVLYLIPFIGMLVTFVLIMMAFGGLLRQLHGAIKAQGNLSTNEI